MAEVVIAPFCAPSDFCALRSRNFITILFSDLFSKPAKKGTKRKFSTDRKPFKKRKMDGETSAKTASKRKFPFKSNDRSSEKRQTKAKKFPIKRTSTGKFKGKGRVLGKKAAKR